MKRKLSVILAVLVIASMMALPASAAPIRQADGEADLPPTAATAVLSKGIVVEPVDATGPARYIVVLKNPPVAQYEGGIDGLEATAPSATGNVKLNASSPQSLAYADFLASEQTTFIADATQAVGRSLEVVYQFQYALNAVVMVLDPAEAATVAKLSGVTLVERDSIQHVDTDYGPTWIGAPAIWNGTGTGGMPGTKGEGVIVGVLDTGINMDHPSFAAVGGDGYVAVNPFGPGVYKGWCNPGFPVQVTCNDKLVGAWDFSDASWGQNDGPEDEDGHGSHTASTAAGNYLAPGTVDLGSFDYSPAISGVAMHANIIAYDVCGPEGCGNADNVAAVNQAIQDGVDVINESISIGSDTWMGAKQQAYLSAVAAGMVVARSAGNSGPASGTVATEPPWTISSGASTHNRAFVNAATDFSGGDTTPPGTLTGLGISGGVGPAPIVYAANAPYSDARCLNPFAAGSVAGKIVVCDRGVNARVAKGWNVLQGGAVGMILTNTSQAQSLNGDVHHLPAVHLRATDGAVLKTWLATGTDHMGSIAGATVNTDPSNGDMMAAFSSRGPQPLGSFVKPDVTNPGVDILAAYRSGEVGPATPTVEYAFVSGTSMSSPHTAGSAALVRALHPTWTPAEIQSALMSTAKVDGVLKEDGLTQANPFDMGAGRVNLNEAGMAGLVLDETAAGFAAANPYLGGDPTTLNLASMANGACVYECGWTRTVKSTQSSAVTWTASLDLADGMTGTVTPNSFTLPAGGTQAVEVMVNVGALDLGEWVFGQLTLTPDSGNVPAAHMPIAVLPAPADLPSVVTIWAHRDSGWKMVEDLTAVEITDLTVDVYGLAKASQSDIWLSQDPTNDSAFDDLSQVWWMSFEVPAGSSRIVAEILASTAPDVDLFWGSGDMPSAATQLGVSAGGSWDEYLSASNPPAGTYWVLVQNWQGSANQPDDITLAMAVVGGDAGNMTVTGPQSVPPLEPFDLNVSWDAEMNVGEVWYGSFMLGTDPANAGNLGLIDVNLHRVNAFDGYTMLSGSTNPVVGGTYVAVSSAISNVVDSAIDTLAIIPIDPDTMYVPGSATGGAYPLTAVAAAQLAAEKGLTDLAARAAGAAPEDVVAVAWAGMMDPGDSAMFGFTAKVTSMSGAVKMDMALFDQATFLHEIPSNELTIVDNSAYPVNRSRRFNVDRDTFINGAQPGMHYGDAQTMWTGLFGQMRPLVHTPVNGIPGDAFVDVAYLYVYIVEGRGFTNWSNSVIDVEARAVTTEWMPVAANWTMPWIMAGGDYGPVLGTNHIGSGKLNTWLRLDVTDAVTDMLRGANNQGFIITNSDSTGVRYALATKEFWDASKAGYVRVYFRTAN